MRVFRDITFEDVGRELGDLGDWAVYTLLGERLGSLIPSVNALGIITVGVISLVVVVFLYWCVSDWRKKRKGGRAYGRRKAKKEGKHRRDAVP